MKKIKNYLGIVLLLSFLLVFIPTNAQIDYGIQAEISISKDNNGVNINAVVKSNSKTKISDLVYKFVSIKKSLNKNFSKNQQSGKFTILPGEKLVLSKQKLNIDQKGSIAISLYILKDNVIIASDYVNTNETKTSNKTTIRKFDINNEIVNNTFSQLGKDFCCFFYKINGLKKSTYPFEVEIKEKIKIGTNLVEIYILVDTEVVYKFITLEKPKYLYAAAQESNKRLDEYYLNRLLY